MHEIEEERSDHIRDNAEPQVARHGAPRPPILFLVRTSWLQLQGVGAIVGVGTAIVVGAAVLYRINQPGPASTSSILALPIAAVAVLFGLIVVFIVWINLAAARAKREIRRTLESDPSIDLEAMSVDESLRRGVPKSLAGIIAFHITQEAAKVGRTGELLHVRLMKRDHPKNPADAIDVTPLDVPIEPLALEARDSRFQEVLTRATAAERERLGDDFSSFEGGVTQNPLPLLRKLISLLMVVVAALSVLVTVGLFARGTPSAAIPFLAMGGVFALLSFGLWRSSTRPPNVFSGGIAYIGRSGRYEFATRRDANMLLNPIGVTILKRTGRPQVLMLGAAERYLAACAWTAPFAPPSPDDLQLFFESENSKS